MIKNEKRIEVMNLPDARLMRLRQVLELVPVSPSAWWAGVKAGIYPRSIKLSPKVTCWRATDIRKLIEPQPEGNTDGVATS
jgi:prophage regulatory protein